jgi:hypothetical protein
MISLAYGIRKADLIDVRSRVWWLGAIEGGVGEGLERLIHGVSYFYIAVTQRSDRNNFKPGDLFWPRLSEVSAHSPLLH